MVKQSFSLEDKSQYIMVPGGPFGKYERELLIHQNRLSAITPVKQAAKKLGFEVENTAEELNGPAYVGNITHEQALSLTLSLDGFTPEIRQFIDFKLLLDQGIKGKPVYDGNGKKVNKDKIASIDDEIFSQRDPWRGEYLGNAFHRIRNLLYIARSFAVKEGKLHLRTIEPLEDCLMEDKTPGIDLSSWIKHANQQGLPPGNIKNGSLWYWCPIDGHVVRFDANSYGVSLICDGDPLDSNAALGVRFAHWK